MDRTALADIDSLEVDQWGAGVASADREQYRGAISLVAAAHRPRRRHYTALGCSRGRSPRCADNLRDLMIVHLDGLMRDARNRDAHLHRTGPPMGSFQRLAGAGQGGVVYVRSPSTAR